MRTSITTEQLVGFWGNVIVDVCFLGDWVRVYRERAAWSAYSSAFQGGGRHFATRAEAVAAAVHKVVTGEWP